MNRKSGDRAGRIFAEYLASQRRRYDERREATVPMDGARAPAATPPGTAEASGPGRYVTLGELARGGMGVILHVWDVLLQRPLAMKILEVGAEQEGTRGAGETIARFLGEAQVAGQLEHPGVVPVHDMGADERGVFFTMRLIEGSDMNRVFDLASAGAEGWSLTRALLVLTRVCEVIACAHSRGVIHRDLKPGNVMVGKFGETYVLDWGLAKEVARPEREGASAPRPDGPEAAPERTVDGTVVGTPAYMAPEQAEGRLADVSFHTDVYAIGALLYRLLAGRSPYATRRGAEDPARTLVLVRRGPPTPLARLARAAPSELVAISEKAMARRPEERYASVEELASDVHAFLQGRVVRAYEGGAWAEAKKLVLRNRSLSALVATLVLVAFGGLAAVTWFRARADRDLRARLAELLAARSEAQEAAEEPGAGALLPVSAAPVTGAAEHLREAARLVAGDPLVQSELGAALVRTGEPVAAIELLEEVLPRLGERDRLQAHVFLGLARCTLGFRSEAREALDLVRASPALAAEPRVRSLCEELELCLAAPTEEERE